MDGLINSGDNDYTGVLVPPVGRQLVPPVTGGAGGAGGGGGIGRIGGVGVVGGGGV